MKEQAKSFLHGARQMVLVSVVLMLICGLLFPLLMTGLSSLFFPYQAGGSVIQAGGKAVAAEHVGQQFLEPHYLWGRPSAYSYNVYTEDEAGNQTYRDGSDFAGVSSGSNNYAPSNPDLAARVEADIAVFLEKNPDVKREDIPTDLVTASGSGLDPHISPASAEVQVPRIAKASGLSETKLREIITAHTGGKLLGIFGEDTVNVVLVNIDIGTAMGLIPS